jgi:hypothetical protein
MKVSKPDQYMQIAGAVQQACTAQSLSIAEPWLQQQQTDLIQPGFVDLIDSIDELELKLSFPPALYAVVSVGDFVMGIVGSEDVGYEIVDLTEDNWPNGPIRRDFRTIAQVGRYIEQRGTSGYALEMRSQKSTAAPAPAAAAAATNASDSTLPMIQTKSSVGGSKVVKKRIKTETPN